VLRPLLGCVLLGLLQAFQVLQTFLSLRVNQLDIFCQPFAGSLIGFLFKARLHRLFMLFEFLDDMFQELFFAFSLTSVSADMCLGFFQQFANFHLN
jgi:hypothetical protein